MFGLGITEIAIIAGVVVLLFGARKLPELGAGLGKAISNFKKSVNDSEAIDITPKENSQERAQEADPEASQADTKK